MSTTEVTPSCLVLIGTYSFEPHTSEGCTFDDESQPRIAFPVTQQFEVSLALFGIEDLQASAVPVV